MTQQRARLFTGGSGGRGAGEIQSQRLQNNADLKNRETQLKHLCKKGLALRGHTRRCAGGTRQPQDRHSTFSGISILLNNLETFHLPMNQHKQTRHHTPFGEGFTWLESPQSCRCGRMQVLQFWCQSSWSLSRLPSARPCAECSSLPAEVGCWQPQIPIYLASPPTRRKGASFSSKPDTY